MYEEANWWVLNSIRSEVRKTFGNLPLLPLCNWVLAWERELCSEVYEYGMILSRWDLASGEWRRRQSKTFFLSFNSSHFKEQKKFERGVLSGAKMCFFHYKLLLMQWALLLFTDVLLWMFMPTPINSAWVNESCKVSVFCVKIMCLSALLKCFYCGI